MSEYKLKTGRIGKKVTEAYKGAEEKFTDSFLEKDASKPSGYALKTGGMADKATAAYKNIEDAVVGSYKKIEEKFVDTFLESANEEENEDQTRS